jgi:triacylglycerol esterase/lipase EstA (alpha/beta hydrolase family)
VSGFAPVDRPGPALQVPRAALDASRRCDRPLDQAERDVVLLVPGTTVDPHESFSWNYQKALAAEDVPHCTVQLPNHTDDDIQVAAEYVVDAVRQIHALSGQRVILLGWSQGASTLPRWALRWWPDIRPMVSSLIGLAPLNNIGSIVGNAPCLIGSCVPAAWQQAVGSDFMEALNSGQQTFPGIAYTAIYSRTDEVVTPDVDGALSVLPEGPNVTNVAIQDVCALDLSEHLLIIASPTAYAIALDAIRHPGEPADLGRVTVDPLCLPGTMPHVDPIDLLAFEATIALNVGPRLVTGAVSAEPPLACYVRGTCGR